MPAVKPGLLPASMLETDRVLVTGGAGMVGSAIVNQLLDAPVSEIVVVDNFVRGHRSNLHDALADSRVTVTEGDIRDRDLVNDVMRGTAVVFHQAALRITQCASDPRSALEVLVDGTFNVLQAAADADVRRVVAASSASVYGLATRFPTPESHHPYGNRTLYGAAKSFNEGMLRSFNEMYGLDYVALRYFNVYGKGMDTFGPYTEALIRWTERIDAGLPPVIFGDGTQTLDLVYVDDVARANCLAASSDLSDAVLNIGSGCEVTLNELASSLLEVMGSTLQPEHTEERAVNPVHRRLADTSQARQLLGFVPTISLEEGLSRLVEWWYQQKGTCARGTEA